MLVHAINPMAEINRIKSGQTTFATLPERPKLVTRMSGSVLKREEAREFDEATDRWWDQVQFIIKTQWLQTL